MPITVPDIPNILIVYDTHYKSQPLSIYFDTAKKIQEVIYQNRITTNPEVLAFAQQELNLHVFQTTTARAQAPNPAEALRQEVAKEREKFVVPAPTHEAPSISQPPPSPKPPVSPLSAADGNFHIHAVCDRCPVACKVDIMHTETGKLLSVTGNACDRGIGFAQNLLLEKFSEPLNF